TSRTRLPNASRSGDSPPWIALTVPRISGGLGSLPACVVRMRSVLRFMSLLLLCSTGRKSPPASLRGDLSHVALLRHTQADRPRLLAPALPGRLYYQFQLAPLFVFRQQVAGSSRRKAALRAQGQVFDRDIARRFVNTAPQFVLGF